MKILLVCNYAPDGQQSMLRFGALLRDQLQARGCEVAVLVPPARLQRADGGARSKWLGYADKYVLFPPRLARWVEAHARAAPGRTVVHVVDHSNAVYVPRRAAVPWVVTCHDLLAVRGALGEDTDCPATWLGRRLQRAIVRGLARADAIAADSASTLRDVERLVPARQAQPRKTILLGLNHPYRRVDGHEARARLAAVPGVPWAKPFLLHVGSNLPRKNKAGVLRVFSRLAPSWPGNLVFCGAPLPEELQREAAAAGLAQRVFAVPAPENAQLEAIYSLAHALVFPSRCEGFGWPVIEAQACGCPVVCSDRTSLPEVGGDAALVHALEDEAGMAAAVARLGEPAFRAEVVARGRANLARFATERMVDAYAALYDEVLAARPR
jgi:glycosyltransferase involved in cell wall biosynthesis